jgi:hypothetical protein
MKHLFIGLALLAAFIETANSAEPQTYTSGPPSMGEAMLVGDLLVVMRGVPHLIQEIRTEKRKVGNSWETFEYNQPRLVTMPREEAVATRDYRVLDMRGNVVDSATLGKRLRELTPVLVCEESRRVDSKYLVIYRPDTLIIYLNPQRPQPNPNEPIPGNPPPKPVQPGQAA